MKLFLASSLQHSGKKIAKTLIQNGLNSKVMFMTTASEGESGDLSWLDDDRQPLLNAGLEVFDYSVTNKTPEEIEKAVKDIGAIFVAGGNTYYLLSHVRKSGFDKIITRLVNEGIPYIGSSAGAILAGQSIETSLDDPSITPELTNYSGLNLCSISVRPHWGSEYFEEQYEREYKRLYSLGKSMMLLADSEYLVVEDGKITLQSVSPKEK